MDTKANMTIMVGLGYCIIWVKRILLKVTIYIIHHNRFGFYLGVANIVLEEDNRADHNPMCGSALKWGHMTGHMTVNSIILLHCNVTCDILLK